LQNHRIKGGTPGSSLDRSRSPARSAGNPQPVQNEPLYLVDICEAIGVTDRTLRVHCQEHLGTSPHRYLWLRRMNQARRALTQANATTQTVTEIANDYGFGELGRFAVSYRKLFGESPSVTLRRPPDDRRSPKLQFR
jgi:AraC-like DNA-binding protein